MDMMDNSQCGGDGGGRAAELGAHPGGGADWRSGGTPERQRRHMPRGSGPRRGSRSTRHPRTRDLPASWWVTQVRRAAPQPRVLFPRLAPAAGACGVCAAVCPGATRGLGENARLLGHSGHGYTAARRGQPAPCLGPSSLAGHFFAACATEARLRCCGGRDRAGRVPSWSWSRLPVAPRQRSPPTGALAARTSPHRSSSPPCPAPRPARARGRQ